MDAALWAEIKRLYGIEKVKITEIARRLRLDRKTVRRAVRAERVPVVVRVIKTPPLLEPYKPYIADRLKTYPRLPATVLLREIKQQGYPGSLRILQEYLHDIRPTAKEVYLRIETPPGEQAQCDWANIGQVTIGKATRRLSAFVMILSHSRLMYVEFTLSQCLEDFIQCHINAFHAFGGIVKKVLYDNLKLVVLSRVGAEIRFNPKFMEFAGVYGFEPVPCNVARGNEKGKVENSIYYLRVNFLAGHPLRWPDINEDVHAWLQDTANVRLHRTTQERPVDRWERERPFLLAPPSRPYDAAIIRAVRSSHQALIRFDGNLYSVPAAHAYKTLILKASPAQVRLFLDTKEIAVHARSYDRAQLVDDPKHYEGILATKRKHFHNILHKRFLELGETAKTFLDGLIHAELHPARHIQQILNLVSAYGKDEVIAAMQHAISCNAFGGVYVQNILLQRRAAQGLPEVQSLDFPQRPEWNEITTEEPDLSIYDQALEGEPKPPTLPDRPKDPASGGDDDGPEALPV
jgi:transposase